eukprot:2287417-Amphidinium_carterae.1
MATEVVVKVAFRDERLTLKEGYLASMAPGEDLSDTISHAISDGQSADPSSRSPSNFHQGGNAGVTATDC